MINAETIQPVINFDGKLCHGSSIMNNEVNKHVTGRQCVFASTATART